MTYIDEIKKSMIEEAIEIHKRIYPAPPDREIHECFTIEDDRIFLWFNTEPDFTTKMLQRELPS